MLFSKKTDMKKGIIIVLLGIVSGHLTVQATSFGEKKDTVTVGIDSLDCYSYDVRNSTLLVGDKQVNYTVVFDSITERRKTEYTEIHGALVPFDAIKFYGEKYRKGILVYKKESEDGDE